MVIDHYISSLRRKIAHWEPTECVGRVVKSTGLILESDGPKSTVGDIVWLKTRLGQMPAEVVGFKDGRLLSMPLAETKEICPGTEIVASNNYASVPIGNGLLGRIIDGLGQPIDGKGPLLADAAFTLYGDIKNPMQRTRITRWLATGIRAIDVFSPLGCGQRIGVFAGSGVGKSTLLGMLARSARSDVNVIALIGERGRELKEFIEDDLGPEGMKRSVVVVATSDQAAPLRVRAAFMAHRIAEAFRDAGQHVLLMMDSVTRLAMAQREIGLAIGEPPTSRGYTPSVFAQMPRLFERAGSFENGSITGLYTVLVEGDDFNEPIADAVRSILDGHVVLSRALAHANHYPAIDVLESLSRLTRAIHGEKHRQLTAVARDMLALYRRNEDLIQVGAYTPKYNLQLDKAVAVYPKLMEFLRQNVGDFTDPSESFEHLQTLLS